MGQESRNLFLYPRVKKSRPLCRARSSSQAENCGVFLLKLPLTVRSPETWAHEPPPLRAPGARRAPCSLDCGCSAHSIFEWLLTHVFLVVSPGTFHVFLVVTDSGTGDSPKDLVFSVVVFREP